jgi:hypothetical protein
MAEAYGRLALDKEAALPLMDLLSEEDLGMVFGSLFLLLAWDDRARGWVVCNREGVTLAGPFRTKGAARNGRGDWVVEVFRQAVEELGC